nr:unnamed protein product [Callosobruchus analis]
MSKVDLCIEKENSFLAASPDSLVACDCCGGGCVEVKCPYLLKEERNEEVSLKHSHSYSYQVQLELRVTASNFCDFVVWSPKDLFIERIYPDEDFWIRNFGRAYGFYKKVVLPELLGKYFTKSKPLNQEWCLCQSVNDNILMI